jgi:hypothetical protein
LASSAIAVALVAVVPDGRHQVVNEVHGDDACPENPPGDHKQGALDHQRRRW